MGRLFGVLLIVVGIWVGIEVYTKGTQNALGGLFAGGSAQAEARDPRTVPQRAGDAVQSAHDVAEQRRSRLLSE
jgi:hypothetical protein